MTTRNQPLSRCNVLGFGRPSPHVSPESLGSKLPRRPVRAQINAAPQPSSTFLRRYQGRLGDPPLPPDRSSKLSFVTLPQTADALHP